jgi:hypothetical protein
MADEEIDIARLTDAGVSKDGNVVRFRIESAAGRTVDVACDHERLEGLIHYIVRLAQLSADRRDDVTPHQFGPTDNITVSPLEISDVGLMKGLETNEGVLVTRLFGFDLGFSVNPAQLRALHAEIERILPKSMLQPQDHHHDHDHDHHHHHHHQQGDHDD